jgi:lipoprotein-anchoring transpeptidase ErfK/SrfK
MTLTRIAVAAFFVACLCGWAGTARADIEVRVDKAAQRMAVIVDGVNSHNWVVSTGTGGGPPSGSYRPQRLERKWNSRTFNWAPMPYSIFFDGPYAIHGTTHVKQLGQRASKGCVRLHPANAAILFALVQKRGMSSTRIIIGSGGMADVKKPRPAKKLASLR